MATKFHAAVISIWMAAPVIVPAWNPLDPVGSFFADVAEMFRTWYAETLIWLVDLLTSVSVPPPQMLVNDFFSFALGGTYGLARQLVVLVAVATAFIILVSPTARHGVKIQRLLVSIAMVVFLGISFYPVYGLLYGLSKAGVDGSMVLVTNGEESIFGTIMRLFDTLNVIDVITTFLAMGISGVFGFFIAGTAVLLFVTTIVTMIGYPLAVAIRPLGSFGNTTFNLFNAAILTTLASPAVVAFLFMAPLLAQKHMPVIALIASPFFALVGSFCALIAPYAIFFMTYQKSKEIFGRIDDASGRMDIGSMPPVSVDEVKHDVDVTSNMNTSALVVDAIGDSLLYGNGKGDFFDDVLKKGVDLGATAATAAGHPYLGFGLKAAGNVYARAREGQSAQGGDVDEDEIILEVVDDDEGGEYYAEQ